ncbi:hypothetical protein RBSH_03836 [Rhodopirellula baltica SH28]|uniref:Uncharacterized protein n=1 Tax=Rhodopirellula baltica SH28 TaxID=993517 RepID=K5DDB4_RHOBT|nr:hypothetical protein RBSH_03836 [Rhodopirellula baltica SH28]
MKNKHGWREVAADERGNLANERVLFACQIREASERSSMAG